ncbi:MAG: oxygenase MpaB family protein [Acidimicrobiales bacterium]
MASTSSSPQPLPQGLVFLAEALGSALGDVRLRLGRELRNLIAGDNPPVRDLSLPIDGDPGLFGPDSVTWKVHSDGSMLIAGVRAILVQTMHPLAMAGVADHSDYRRHPLDRLANTSQFVAATTFGTTEQADAAFALVRRVHERVVGLAPDGREYSANDPHLLSWVHHAEVDSFLRTYQRYGASPLTSAEADKYVDEMSVINDRLGGDYAAHSVAELEDWMQSIRPELEAGQQARDAARWLMLAPLPLTARPAYGVIAPAAVGLLPNWMREQLKLPYVQALDPVVVQPAARALIRTLTWAITGVIEAEAA